MPLTSTGLVIPTLTEIRDQINQICRSKFGESIDLSDNSLMGQFVGIVAERERLVYELGQAVNASQDPDQATGAALDAICAYTGTVRRAAEPSEAILTLVGDPGTVVPAGSRAAVEVTEDEFETAADATLVAATAWAQSTAYTLGQIRTTNGNVYLVITAGTSAGAGTGPSTESLDITDGTAHWRFLGNGTATITVEATSVEEDAIQALAFTLTEVVTPVSGLNQVTNLLDAAPGRPIETDEELAIRREIELSRAGTATVDAIRADLLGVDGVSAVTVFENDTDFTNGDGMPPHSFEALVQGGDDQDVFDQVFLSKPAGIQSHGTETGSATDSSGTAHTVKFSRPDEVEIYVVVQLTKDPAEYPLGGDDLVEAAILAWGGALATGRDVVASAISAQVFSVDGVLDVPSVFIGTAPAPGTSTTVSITVRQRAVFDSTRISITSSNGTP